jgi:hypothetical protein
MFTESCDRRTFPLTLCPLPQAGEGSGLGRAARDGFVQWGALEWE